MPVVGSSASSWPPIRSATIRALLPDKAYDTDAIRNFAKQRKCWANIPAMGNRKQTFSLSRWVYRQRNLVERFFNRIKQMRGLATRCGRRAANYLAGLKFAATRI
ncbi:transposase [Agrobacterium sp. T29]|uniref:transposase n=1 Tax=Agrobacterium sp. T29 TaxID=2580515 RepID=UPI00115DEE22